MSKAHAASPARAGYPRAGQHGRIVHAIGRRIVKGEIQPGEQLPTPARVRRQPGRRPRGGQGPRRQGTGGVAAEDRDAGPAAASPGTCSIPTSWPGARRECPRAPSSAKLTEVRLLIEPGAAELAARRARPAQVAALQAALRDMRDALDLSPPDYAAYNEADIRFHRTIVQACDNEVLEQVGAIVNTTLLVAFNAAIRVPGLAPSSLPRHQAILDAIRRRQPNRAGAAMRLLVQNTGRAIRKLRR